MAATNVQQNWSAVSFTPAGGSLIHIPNVNGIDIDSGGQLNRYKGDNARFTTVVTNPTNEPTITVRSAAVGVIAGLAPGTLGSFTATHLDALGASGGNVVYVMTNAILQGPSSGGAHAQYGESTLVIGCFSSDGTTNPVAFTLV